MLSPFHVLVRVIIVNFAIQWIPSSDPAPEHLMFVLLYVASDVANADEHVHELTDQNEHYSLQERLLDFGPVIQQLVVFVALYLYNCGPEIGRNRD